MKSLVHNQLAKFNAKQPASERDSPFDDDPIILIMPEKVIAAGIEAQNEWIQKHSDDPNVEIYIPKKIDVK